MSAGTLVFSHANGFPAGTYRLLFEAWRQAGWRVEAIEKIGHDPRYPVTSNWPRLRDQLIDFITERQAGPAWLVGHSLGGLLSLLAASRRPDLARGVLLLDSPVITGWQAHTLRALKLSGLAARLGPGKVSRARRHEWPSAQAAHQHFAAKTIFSRWDARVLHDYIHAGTCAGPAGAHLAFERDIETRIYNTLPHHLGGVLRRHPPQCPEHFIGGTASVEMRQAGLEGTRRITHGRMQWLEGSHLFPFEQPDQTAAAVLGILAGRQEGEPGHL
jgi:pimeloyl-ACP methyl ester carboxylesterase